MANEKVLIIKTGYAESLDYNLDSRKVSLGDVLRTTPLLHLFKEDHVSWATDSEALLLLDGNPFIDRLMTFDQFLPYQLENERFDTVINLEKVSGICAMTDKIHAWKKYGFRFDSESGEAKAYDHAFDVLAVSANPQLKKENVKTAQELLFEMVGKKWDGEEYVLGYKPSTTEQYDLSFNVVVGSKWPNKTWPEKNWNKLERMLKSEGLKVTRQDKQPKEMFENIHRYIDWINQSRLVVSNDSLGLHIALAVKKKVIGLFGPTPSKEVYFYGRGEAITTDDDLSECLPCFKPTCIHETNCMSRISPEKVYEKVNLYLKK